MGFPDDGSVVKNLPAVQETPIQFPGQEDPLERERLPASVFWPGEFHGRYSPWGCKELDTTVSETVKRRVTFWEKQSGGPEGT